LIDNKRPASAQNSRVLNTYLEIYPLSGDQEY